MSHGSDKNVLPFSVILLYTPAPNDSEDFRAVGQDETSITLQWTKMNDFFNYTVEFDGNETNIPASEDQVTVTNLTNTKKYNFTLFTVFKYARSSGVRTSAATGEKAVFFLR